MTSNEIQAIRRYASRLRISARSSQLIADVQKPGEMVRSSFLADLMRSDANDFSEIAHHLETLAETSQQRSPSRD